MLDNKVVTVIFCKKRIIRPDFLYYVEFDTLRLPKPDPELEPDAFRIAASFLTTRQTNEYHPVRKQHINSA